MGTQSTSNPRVAVVGAGVVGLSLAWRLAQGGADVALIDQDAPGRGASWAAAGMLAPTFETAEAPGAHPDLFAFGRASLALWPRFAASLEAASGVSVDLRLDGVLAPAFGAVDADRIRRDVERLGARGSDLRWLQAAQARALEPGLAPDLVGAAFAPSDGQVDNRRLVDALEIAVRRAHVRVQTGAAVAQIARRRSVWRVQDHGARTLIEADAVVLASGAATAAIESPAPSPPIAPVKGQMLSLALDRPPQIARVLRTPGAYLAPKSDGRLNVGATVEPAARDLNVAPDAVARLRAAAVRIAPSLAGAPVLETWAGARPGTPDQGPVLGPVDDGLIFAAGHYRNGILQAPVTAEMIAELVLRGVRSPFFEAFRADRFVSGAGPVNALSGSRP